MYLLDAYTRLKNLFGDLLRLEPDALHVHVGIAVFFAVALLVRGRRPFVTAYWVVLAVAVAAEVFDLLYDLQLGNRLRWMNSIKDIGNAMIWPTAWMLVGSRIARLVRQPSPIGFPPAQPPAAGRSRSRMTPTTTGFGPPLCAARPAERAPELEGAGK